jgi:hypothetical protein
MELSVIRVDDYKAVLKLTGPTAIYRGNQREVWVALRHHLCARGRPVWNVALYDNPRCENYFSWIDPATKQAFFDSHQLVEVCEWLGVTDVESVVAAAVRLKPTGRIESHGCGYCRRAEAG